MTALELIASGDIDVVHICTPNDLHHPLAEAALASGKHVVCEKPLAVSVADARALCAAADAAGLVATVPFVYRFYPMVREARARLADAGRPGAAHPRQLPAGLAVHRAGRQLARRQQPRRSVTGLRRHRLALVRPRRVRHRRPHRVGVRRADHGAARAPVGGRRAPRVRAAGDQRRLRAVGRHRGRRPGHVPHGAGRDGFAGGQPDLVRSQEPAALRDRRRPTRRWPSTRSSPTRCGSVGEGRRELSTRDAGPPRTRGRGLRDRCRPDIRRGTRTASTPSSPIPIERSRSDRPPPSTACRRSSTGCGPCRSPTPCCGPPRPTAGWTSSSATSRLDERSVCHEARVPHRLPPAPEPRRDLRVGRGARLRGARGRGVARPRRSPVHRDPPLRRRVRRAPRPTRRASCSPGTASSSRRSPTTTTTSTPTPTSARRSTRTSTGASTPRRCSGARPSARSSVATRRARWPRTSARREAVFRPLVDHAGEAGVKLIIENCVMEGWHPDGYPGNLAYSPELWEWMFSLGLYLNYDPSHLLWMGIDPVEAVKPYVDRIPHAQAKDIELDPAARNRFGWPGRAVAAGRPVGRRLVALPGSRPRPGRLVAARRRPLRGRVRRRALRRARGPGVGRHRGEGRDRAAHRPRHAATPDRRVMAAPPVLEVSGLVKTYPGVRALGGVDFDVRAGEVHCIVGPNGAGKSTLIKCIAGSIAPTAGEIRIDGELLVRWSRRRRSTAGWPRSTRSSTSSATSPSRTTSSSGTSGGAVGFLDRRRMRRETAELFSA